MVNTELLEDAIRRSGKRKQYLADKIGFYDIYELVRGAVAATEFVAAPTLEQILLTDQQARAYVHANMK